MKTSIILVRISGAICLFFMISHCTFGRAFNWEQSLSCLSISDRAIFITYHYILILVLGFASVLLLIQPAALLSSPLRFTILGMFILFYIIRIITEFTLFGYTMPQSPVIIIMCTVPVILWLISLSLRNN